MMVNPSFPAKTIPEFIAYAKANPGKINMASPGIGSVNHIAGELFKMMTGVDLVHVPYRGQPVSRSARRTGAGLLWSSAVSIENIRSGKLRRLAVTTATRMEVLPDVPTLSDFVPGYEASAWEGVGAPKDTPAEIIDKLNVEINAAFADPSFKARLADLGVEAFPGSPAEFDKFIVEYTEKWAKVIRAANIKAE